MKNLVFLIISLSSMLSFSQVSTSPVTPTVNDEITIIFDASGTELENYTGDVYAHTGVLTNESANNGDWKYVIGTWGNNTQPKLTRIDTNTYQLVITTNVFSFYSIETNTTEIITHLAVVFRSADASKQSKPDYFIQLYDEGLNIAFTNPGDKDIFDLNETVTISAESSIAADLELFINNNSIKTETNQNTIASSYQFLTGGNYILKTTATASGETKETEISVFVKTPTIVAPKPAGLNYGLNKNPDNSVTFLLQAPFKNDVFVIGDFNNWQLNSTYQLFKDGEDFWITLPDLDPNMEYAYQYVVDYTITIADPYSEKILDPWNDQYIPESTYPNLKSYPTDLTTGIVSTFTINEPEYNWTSTNYTKPNQENLVVYEMLLRDFTLVGTDDIGDINTALTHLNYLDSLGVTAIELMPVNEFEGNDSWGYNPSFHNALDKAYGTKNDFKKFIDACHEKGIAVILDIVYNHAFGQSPLAQMYWDSGNSRPSDANPWLNVTATHPFNVGNDFNHESNYTKTYVKQTITHWLDEFRIDGFRFDLSKGFTQTNNPDNVIAWSAYDASRIAILKDYATHIWSNTSNEIYLILEHFAQNTEEKELSDFGFMFWGNSNHNYNQNTMGFSSDSDISWMSYKNRGWNDPHVVGYMESHDEERLMYKNLQFGNSNNDYNVKELNTALTRQEIAGLFFFPIPGPKMIWQFGELGYDYSINTCTDGTVSDDCRLSRKPIKWEYANDPNRKQIYNTWATLTAFKKKEPAFSTDNFTMYTGNTYTKSIVLEHASMDVVIAGNFGIESATLTPYFTQTGIWYEYFSGEQKNVTSTSETIDLRPGEYKLYSTVKLLDPRGGTALDDSDRDGIVDTEDLCPNSPINVKVDENGCKLFSLPPDNFEIETIGETCLDKNNGRLLIQAKETENYVATLNGTDYNFTNNLEITNLVAGTYTICITVLNEDYEQCYTVAIAEGSTISGKASIISKKVAIDIFEGTAPFKILVNGNAVLESESYSFSVDVNHGDLVQVKTAVACEGIFSKSIEFSNTITAYPNPTSGWIEILLPTHQNYINGVVIELYSLNSQLISSKTYPVVSGKARLNLDKLSKGLYIASIKLDKTVSIKIIKK